MSINLATTLHGMPGAEIGFNPHTWTFFLLFVLVGVCLTLPLFWLGQRLLLWTPADWAREGCWPFRHRWKCFEKMSFSIHDQKAAPCQHEAKLFVCLRCGEQHVEVSLPRGIKFSVTPEQYAKAVADLRAESRGLCLEYSHTGPDLE